MNREAVVYLVRDANDNDVQCTLSRDEAREIERDNPKLKVVRAIATPAPREDGGA